MSIGTISVYILIVVLNPGRDLVPDIYDHHGGPR